ncbi:hypothetical protein CPB84DRAFT_1772643 [Gymnopilus junonius]|uniref:MYND-type domain-containing protein n=1 Tax=Gymnopilus junonius TaxID=109634 RepID=A0A9P5NUQ1_GYMJU|nr:hypothetical protein CPB84DRAFT_1772643 [Gymnopilus junonius]
MATIQSCLMCGTPTTKSCSSCKSVSYCNREHQKKDWRAHKEYCLKVKAAGANTFDAILFAVNETKPRLVKVPWELSRVSEDDVQYQKLDTDVWFKQDAAVRPLYFHRLGINGPQLGRALCFKYDDDFSINGSPLNRCIVNVTEGKAGHPWCGNIVALRMQSLYTYDFYDNVDIEQDLKLFVTYFEEYGRVKPVD